MKEEESHPNKLKTKVLTGKIFIVPAKQPIRPGRKGGSHMELWIFFFLVGPIAEWEPTRTNGTLGP